MKLIKTEIYSVGPYYQFYDEEEFVLTTCIMHETLNLQELKEIWDTEAFTVAKKAEKFYFSTYDKKPAEDYWVALKAGRDKYAILLKELEYRESDNCHLLNDDFPYSLSEVNETIKEFREYENYEWMSLKEMFTNFETFKEYIENIKLNLEGKTN